MLVPTNTPLLILLRNSNEVYNVKVVSNGMINPMGFVGKNSKFTRKR